MSDTNPVAVKSANGPACVDGQISLNQRWAQHRKVTEAADQYDAVLLSPATVALALVIMIVSESGRSIAARSAALGTKSPFQFSGLCQLKSPASPSEYTTETTCAFAAATLLVKSV
jgi:hypothetical protein